VSIGLHFWKISLNKQFYYLVFIKRVPSPNDAKLPWYCTPCALSCYVYYLMRGSYQHFNLQSSIVQRTWAISKHCSPKDYPNYSLTSFSWLLLNETVYSSSLELASKFMWSMLFLVYPLGCINNGNHINWKQNYQT